MTKILFIIIIFNVLLSACGKVRESAGVNRKVIDEYAVVENPPLVIPPNFNLLPPDQIKSKDIENTDSELAKEILFGLDDNNIKQSESNSLIDEIIKETKADKVDNSIRNEINEQFAGEKSTAKDESIFTNNDQLDKAIENTEQRNNTDTTGDVKKNKKKKRFIFF